MLVPFKSLSKYNSKVYEFLSNNPDKLSRVNGDGENILYMDFVLDEYKDLLVEKCPESLKIKVCGLTLLFTDRVHDRFKKKMVELYPETLEVPGYSGENILFKSSIDDHYKDLLVARNPDALRQLDSEGRNILFFKDVPGKYKRKLLELYPESLTHTDNEGRGLLEYIEHGDYITDVLEYHNGLWWGRCRYIYYKNFDRTYVNKLLELHPETVLKQLQERGINILSTKISDEQKKMIVERYPDSLAFIDKNGMNILFYNHISDYYKELLVERYPDSLRQIDNHGQNILFYYHVSDTFKERLVERYPDALRQVDNKGKTIRSYDSGKYKKKLLELYP